MDSLADYIAQVATPMSGPTGKNAGPERLRDVPPGTPHDVSSPRSAASPDLVRDHAILIRAGARDEAAVRELYRTHVARVHRHVARILGANDGDVEDVVQQVFLAALDGAARFDGRSAVSTWLLGIATRRAVDQLRSRGRRDRWRKMGEMIGLSGGSRGPDEAHAMRSEAELALEVLKPDVKLVFVLCEVEGYTLAEVSEMTGTAVSTLHARLQAARAKLDAHTGTMGEGGNHE